MATEVTADMKVEDYTIQEIDSMLPASLNKIQSKAAEEVGQVEE